MARSTNPFHAVGVCLWAVLLSCAPLLCGCGYNPGVAATEPLIVADCDSSTAADDLIVLDWSGGGSNIYPDEEFPGLDFASFETTEDGTLADDANAFKEAVRREVVHILCELPFVSVTVRNDKVRMGADATTVYVVQAPSQAGAGQIGEGEYDPCNLHHDNNALVFGEEFLELPGSYSFDEWVLIFANVIAHEIGHTLGFNHVPRSETSDSEHVLYVELMLPAHTVDEMISPQRFLSDETNCPDDAAHTRRMDAGTLTCGLPEPVGP